MNLPVTSDPGPGEAQAVGALRVRRVRLVRSPAILVGAGLLLVIIVLAVGAPWFAPYGPDAQHITARLLPPSPAHWFGTDDYGRDELSRELFGFRLSLEIGALVMLGTTGAGLVVGVLAGFLPRLDGLLMRLMDGFMAFPWMVLALAFVAFLGHSVPNVVVVLTLVYTPRMARLVRSVTLVEREKEYVTAARAIGVGTPRILVRHILPNVLDPVVVQATFTFAYAVLGEALLSFLGVGVPPYLPSLGEMISSGEEYLTQAPWMTLFPGLGIMAIVMALNLLGDGLRDLLDPRQRERWGFRA